MVYISQFAVDMPIGYNTAMTASSARKARTFKNYHAAFKYLFEHVNHERMRKIRLRASMFKLDRMEALCEALGRPQNAVRMVHVVGSKGKGSTVSMIEASLRKCGYTVGTYTSPHLVDLRERICVNGDPISTATFADIMGRLATAADEVADKVESPSFFELMTAMAFCHFADQAVDIAVVEAGLGGRLDCTNVITPVVTAVTAISRDHTHILGDTLAEIAREKAGVFKPGVPSSPSRRTPRPRRSSARSPRTSGRRSRSAARRSTSPTDSRRALTSARTRASVSRPTRRSSSTCPAHLRASTRRSTAASPSPCSTNSASAACR
jgi:folylpolyglutamate synthase/dihydropteroate synthase